MTGAKTEHDAQRVFPTDTLVAHHRSCMQLFEQALQELN